MCCVHSGEYATHRCLQPAQMSSYYPGHRDVMTQCSIDRHCNISCLSYSSSQSSPVCRKAKHMTEFVAHEAIFPAPDTNLAHFDMRDSVAPPPSVPLVRTGSTSSYSRTAFCPSEGDGHRLGINKMEGTKVFGLYDITLSERKTVTYSHKTPEFQCDGLQHAAGRWSSAKSCY